MSRRGNIAKEKTEKSDSIYRNGLVNMLVNQITKHKKIYQIIYQTMKKIQQKGRNESIICFNYVKQY